MSYLRVLLRRFDGDVGLALAAYNAGEGAVRRQVGGGAPASAETAAYVAAIRRAYPPKRHPVPPAARAGAPAPRGFSVERTAAGIIVNRGPGGS